MPILAKDRDVPLKCIVVGGGIVGLASAAALRRAGHHVTVYESSSFANEAGAAIHIAPNALRALRHIGANESTLQAVPCHCIRIVLPDGKEMVPVDAGVIESKLGINTDWSLAHRADLHKCVKEAALSASSNETPVVLKLASKVTKIDAEEGVVHFADGSTDEADLIIGADGIKSIAAEAVSEAKSTLISTGQNCFRFVIPTDKVLANPLTRSFVARFGGASCSIFIAGDRRIVVYPCRDFKLLNVVCIHPESETSTSEDFGWQTPAKVEDVLRVYEGRVSSQLIELLELAQDIALWNLSSRDPPRTFVKGKIALVGDAAHPTLPHQGQGAAQGLEDAVALGELINKSTTRDELASRLALYNRVRYDRAVTVAILGRVDDMSREKMLPTLHKFVPNATNPVTMPAFAWPYDVVAASREALVT